MILNWVGSPKDNSSLSDFSSLLSYSGSRRRFVHPPLTTFWMKTKTIRETNKQILLRCIFRTLWFLFFDKIRKIAYALDISISYLMLLKLYWNYAQLIFCYKNLPRKQSLVWWRVNYYFSNYFNPFNNIFLNKNSCVVERRYNIILQIALITLIQVFLNGSV